MQTATLILQRLLQMQDMNEDDVSAIETPPGGADATGEALLQGRPGWMRSLYKSVKAWLDVLPEDIPDLVRTAESGSNPLFRWLHRETRLAIAQQVI